MKTRFSTIDIRAAIAEIREQFVSLRAVNIYDVDNKTYIIKFNKPDSKMMLLMESGTRLHITEYEWPKNATPSGFTMKLRKHLRSRRLESVDQLGSDRIVDLQFGSGEAAYHVVLELYDRGNIVLTDNQLIILNILRPRTDDSQDVRFAVKEKYPVELAKQPEPFIGLDGLRSLLVAAQPGDNLRKILNPVLPCGPAVVEHCLLTAGFAQNVGVGKGFNVETDLGTLCKAVEEAEAMTSRSASVCRGYIVQRAELRPAAVPALDAENTSGSGSAALLTYDEFHPFLLRQHCNSKYIEFDTFNKAVDEFFSKLEAQKIDLKALQAEKAALRKLDNVKKDHEKRLTELQHGQEEDSAKAELIEMNLPLVDRAILIVNSAIANQFDWAHIWDLVREAQLQGDPVARAIKGLKLDTNHVTLLLQDPYSAAEADDSDDSSDEERKSADLGLGSSTAVRPMKIDVDLGLSAYANAKKYYDHRRLAVDKMQKTVLASSKALRSAERTTKELLKDAQSAATINKARRVHWFEKFLWLITSENYLAVGGRDAQQNEIIVKRHLRPGDVYVHADLHGAASIVVKNPSGAPIPPKTLNEVGCMAICNSAAWDAKVVTSAWWVYHDQVSKTAPTGEYLTTGSFMVRGKKNYLPPSHLIYGFGLLFKLDEESTARHRGERRVRTADEEAQQLQQSAGAAAGAEGSGAVAAAQDSEAELSGLEAGDSSSSSGGGSGDDDSADEAAAVTEGKRIAPSSPAHADHVAATLRRQLDSKAPQSKGEEATAVVPELTVEARVKVDDAAGDSDGSSEGETAFPDTRIRVPSLAEGDSFASRLRAESVVSEESAAGRLPAAAASMAAAAASTLDPAAAAAAADGVQRIVVGSEVLEFGRKVTRERKSNASQVENSSRDKKQGRGQQPQRHGDADDVEGSAAGHLSSQATTAKHSSAPVVAEKSQAAQLKRGQKSKLRKIKEKYADQDDEERQLRMSLLRSAPPPKAPPPPASAAAARGKAGARGGGRPPSGAQAGRGAGRPLSAVDQRPLGSTGTASGSGQPGRAAVMLPAGGRAGRVAGPLAEANGAGVQNDGQQSAVADGEDDEEDEQQEGSSGPGGAAADVEVLDSLTGRPAVEDLLLFAIPFCAPYSVLQNFKFKVKLTPGTTKRGKASKAAIQSFLHDKAVTAREKDLLKALKDVDVSRNMPGKVKVSAPNLHRSKGK